MEKFASFLFDLDGTLLDTAPDFQACISIMHEKYGLPEMDPVAFRSQVSLGGRAMVRFGFDLIDSDPKLNTLLEEFLSIYEDIIGQQCAWFSGMDTVLQNLEEKQIPWGIVTNKPQKFTELLIDKFPILKETNCIVCGDTLDTKKPDAAPLLHGLKKLNQNSAHSLYIGDAKTDVEASHNAGLKCMIAEYGYIPKDDDAKSWQADYYIQSPHQILEYV